MVNLESSVPFVHRRQWEDEPGSWEEEIAKKGLIWWPEKSRENGPHELLCLSVCTIKIAGVLIWERLDSVAM